MRLDFLQAARGGEMPVRLSRPARCPECGDAGREDCPACAGRGEVTEKAVIPVQVPAGIDEGGNFRVPGQGAPGRFGGPPGDLIIVVSCSGHPTLHRDGLTVYGVVQVPAFRLDEGGPVRVPTVQGGARIQIPPRTPSGRVFRLKGWGIHRAREGRTQEGDHVVRVVEMPESAEVWAERTSPRYRARSRR